jgi:hypothetical protein
MQLVPDSDVVEPQVNCTVSMLDALDLLIDTQALTISFFQLAPAEVRAHAVLSSGVTDNVAAMKAASNVKSGSR